MIHFKSDYMCKFKTFFKINIISKDFFYYSKLGMKKNIGSVRFTISQVLE